MANLKHIKYTTEAKYNAGTKSDDTLYAVPIPKTTAGDVDSGNATSGQVLTANGAGGASWQTAGGGGGGGSSLNKYTFTYNSPFSSNDFDIILNIVKNAKGRVYVSVLGELDFVLQSMGGDFIISASAVSYENLNYIPEYRMSIDEGDIKLFVYTTSFASGSPNTPYVERSDISEMVTSVDVIYYNDSEILTPIS